MLAVYAQLIYKINKLSLYIYVEYLTIVPFKSRHL